MARRWAAELAAVVGIAALALVLYHRTADFWWVHDDFFQLTYVAEHRALDYALDPEVWQRLPTRMVTPLLMLSLDADLALFGPRARPFHLRQLGALALAAVALYGLLRLWHGRRWAVAGAALFLLGPPVTALASLLMVRHYVEGLLLALGAGIAFVLAVRRESWWWAVGSAVVAFTAMLAKEVFVPLPLLLPLLPEGGARERWRFAAPHALALALYAGYRLHLLDTLVGGYGVVVPGGERAAFVAGLPVRLAAAIAGGDGGVGWLVVAIVVLAALALAVRGRRAALLVAAAAVAALAPLVPVGEMKPRYATVGWVLLSIAFAFAAAELDRRGRGGRRLALVALAAVAVAALVANRTAWAETVRVRARLEAENRAALTLGPRDLLDHPLEESAALDALPAFAARFHGRRATAGRFSDDLFLCAGGAEGKRVWSWDPAAGRLLEIGDRVAERRRRYCGGIRRRAPLAARFRPADPVLWWRLGPYPEGEYRFVLAGGVRSVPVPREGGYWLQRRGDIRLRVRYRSPEGWVTYSPELTVELDSGEMVDWRRGPAPGER